MNKRSTKRPVAEHAAPDPEEQNRAFLMGLENHTAKELLKGNLRLVSALWLMQRPPGWTVQKLQDLPEEALLPPETAKKMFLNPLYNAIYTVPRVVALSYRWLTPEHPDPDGVQLKQARKFLSKLLGFAAGYRINFKDAVDVKDVDVGVLWDFMSLPQQPRVTQKQKEQFREGLSIINRLYGSSANTLTLQLTGTPPGITGYHSSGWCLFEDAVSRLLKRTSLLCSMDETVDFDGHDRRRKRRDSIFDEFQKTPVFCAVLGAVGWKPVFEPDFLNDDCSFSASCSVRTREFDPMQKCSAFFAALGVEGCGFVSEVKFLNIINVLGAARKPPIHPENLAGILRSDKVKFTCGSDVELVIEKYRLFCEEVAGGVVILDFEANPREVTSFRTFYDAVKWSEDDMHLFSQAIVLFSKCQVLKLGGHALTKKTAAILTDALVRMPAWKLVDFTLPGDGTLRWFYEGTAAQQAVLGALARSAFSVAYLTRLSNAGDSCGRKTRILCTEINRILRIPSEESAHKRHPNSTPFSPSCHRCAVNRHSSDRFCNFRRRRTHVQSPMMH